MKISREVKGELLMAGTVLAGSIFPVLIKFSAGLLPVFFFAGVSMIIASFVALPFVIRKKFNIKALPYMTISVFFIAFIFPVLIFAGQKTTAGNFAILGNSEALFSFLFFGFLGIDKITKSRVMGATLLLFGVILVILNDFSGGLNVYDFLLILVCAFCPFGNYFQQKAVRMISPMIYFCFRSFLAGSVLLIISFSTENIPTLEFSHWKILLLTGILHFGISKILWLKAIRLIDFSKAISLASATPAVALIFAFFFLDEIPNYMQIIGLFAMLFGVYLMTHHERKIAGQQI